jgi:hypothetical protein
MVRPWARLHRRMSVRISAYAHRAEGCASSYAMGFVVQEASSRFGRGSLVRKTDSREDLLQSVEVRRLDEMMIEAGLSGLVFV